MATSKTRVEIGRTSNDLSIVKVMTGGKGRPSFEVEVSSGKFMPYKAWLVENDQPVVPFKPHAPKTDEVVEDAVAGATEPDVEGIIASAQRGLASEVAGGREPVNAE